MICGLLCWGRDHVICIKTCTEYFSRNAEAELNLLHVGKSETKHT